MKLMAVPSAWRRSSAGSYGRECCCSGSRPQTGSSGGCPPRSGTLSGSPGRWTSLGGGPASLAPPIACQQRIKWVWAELVHTLRACVSTHQLSKVGVFRCSLTSSITCSELQPRLSVTDLAGAFLAAFGSWSCWIQDPWAASETELSVIIGSTFRSRMAWDSLEIWS